MTLFYHQLTNHSKYTTHIYNDNYTVMIHIVIMNMSYYNDDYIK